VPEPQARWHLAKTPIALDDLLLRIRWARASSQRTGRRGMRAEPCRPL
jgi:hypothetical protein